MMAMLAFAIDVGYLCLARNEMQRSADAAAIAGAWEFIDQAALAGDEDYCALYWNARDMADDFAAENAVLRSAPVLASDDISVGYLSAPWDPNCAMDFSWQNAPNAIRVRVQRTSGVNGEVPFFMAKVLGIHSAATQAEATAALVTSFNGFQVPSDGGNLGILPFALDEDTWNGLVGDPCDDWCWDDELKEARPGTDGILEVNLYPQGTGSPGNRGTVDIGSSNNSTTDIARQITDGVTPEDLEFHGGKLEFDENGVIDLNGDTGISAGVKDELASVIGKPRMVPIFREVNGPGNNAQYTIVKFVGIRIMHVKLTGSASKKCVMIQPANMVARGGIPSTGPSKTDFVYSPVWLVR
jgi:hypothetical protein